jgi:hypothetical protein
MTSQNFFPPFFLFSSRQDVEEARREREDAVGKHEAARALSEEDYQRSLKALKEDHARRHQQACQQLVKHASSE